MFSHLVVSSVSLGSTFGSVGHRGLPPSHLECRPVTQVSGLSMAADDSDRIRTAPWEAGGWLAPVRSAHVEEMHRLVRLHLFHILIDMSLSPDKYISFPPGF